MLGQGNTFGAIGDPPLYHSAPAAATAACFVHVLLSRGSVRITLALSSQVEAYLKRSRMDLRYSS